MTKILLTGGTGFIGKFILRELVKINDCKVSVFTRKDCASFENATCFKGDISNRDSVRKAVSGQDCVVHCAGAKLSAGSFFSTNVTGTQNIVDACREYGIRKLIHLSSVGVIGTEGEAGVSEMSPCSPGNEYEKTKHNAELIALKLADEDPGRVTVLRPTNVYGENDPECHLLNLITKIKSNRFCFVGSDLSGFYLNYLYVREISSLFPGLLYSKLPNSVYIVNTPVHLHDFVMTIHGILGKREPIKSLPHWPVKMLAKIFDQVPQSVLNHPPINSRKLNELTNRKVYSAERLAKDMLWVPAYTHKQALISLIDWYHEKHYLI